MSQHLNNAVAVIGIDIGKNSFHMSALMLAAQSCCSEMVAWPDRSTVGQYAAGGLNRSTQHLH